MRPNDPEIADFAGLMQKAGVVLMADESACSLGDMEKIAGEGYYEMINVRLSKCGGFRNSLKIIDYLRVREFLSRSDATLASPAFFRPPAGFYAFFAVMPYTVTVHMMNFW